VSSPSARSRADTRLWGHGPLSCDDTYLVRSFNNFCNLKQTPFILKHYLVCWLISLWLFYQRATTSRSLFHR
jgi:hypothetical protein